MGKSHSQVSQSESDTNLTSRRAAWQASALDAETRALLVEDERYFLRQSVSTPCLNVIAKAEGIWIEDTSGRRYMDFHGNNVHHIGYGHPRLKGAIAAQMDALPFAPRRYACAASVALAKKLAEISPGDLSKVLFTTGGSDAVEVAVKIARTATGRHKTLSDAQGRPQLELCNTQCARMVDYVLSREGDVAAVVAEPARAVPYLPPPGFWRIVREACDRHGAKLIFDEIPTGLGKTGRMFACDHDGVVPDILVMGKALGGGIVPIAAVIARPDLDVGGDWAFGHYTHEKNPVSARAALTTIEIIEDEKLVENAARVGAVALARLEEMKARHRVIGDVRGRGLLIGIDLVIDRATKQPTTDLAEAIMYRAFDRDLSFKTSMGNILTLTPPLTVTEAQMLRALDIIDEALADV